MVLVMENESYDQIIGNSAAPYINSLANTYLRATCSYANAHNSLPNYLEMISGHAYEASGTRNDCTPSSCGPIAGTDIADQLDAARISWKAFMGAMPSDCDSNDAGGSGGYGVRHDPFVYFSQGRTSPECGNDVPSTDLLAALDSSTPPDFVFYSPSICEDGGNDAPCSTIANGDRFLKGCVPAIMATSWYRDGGTIILTWDESAGSDTSGRYGDKGGTCSRWSSRRVRRATNLLIVTSTPPASCGLSNTPTGSATWVPPPNPTQAACRWPPTVTEGATQPVSTSLVSRSDPSVTEARHRTASTGR
jgi:Phosphoesterase family